MDQEQIPHADLSELQRQFDTFAKTPAVYTRMFDPVVPSASQRGPLHHWLISIKDNFDVAGQVTMAGSRVCADDPPAVSDASVVARLKAAGAILVGKTTMTEFAFSGVGINPHVGTPLHPFSSSVARIPGGSSSGAAVSVALQQVRAALGTDTGGSVRIPAALCGLVGYKGTQSRTPLGGVMELSRTLDTVGVIARNVADALAVDAVCAGVALSTTVASPARVRLAIAQSLFFEDIQAEVLTSFNNAVAQLRDAGFQIETIDFSCASEVASRSLPAGFSAIEAYAAHEHRLQRQPQQVDPRVAARMMLGKGVSAQDYLRLHDRRREWIAMAHQQLQGFDGFICPTVPIVAPPLAPLVDDDEQFFKTNRLLLRNPSLVNYLDGCAWSLPIQPADGLPVGLMLAGIAHQDQRLAEIARLIEACLGRANSVK